MSLQKAFILKQHDMKRASFKIIPFILFAFLILPLTSCGQAKKSTEPTAQKIFDYTKGYIEQQQKEGYFKIYDSQTNRTLYLTGATDIRRVKCALGNNQYYNCAVFTAKDGNKYDIDFFLKWDGKHFTTTHVILHKTNTKPRYVWDLDKKVGLWNALKTGQIDSSKQWTGEKQFPNTNIVYDEATKTKPVFVWFKDQASGKWKALDVHYQVDPDVAKLYHSDRKL